MDDARSGPVHMPAFLAEDGVLCHQTGKLPASGNRLIRAVDVTGEVDDREGGLGPGSGKVHARLSLSHGRSGGERGGRVCVWVGMKDGEVCVEKIGKRE